MAYFADTTTQQKLDELGFNYIKLFDDTEIQQFKNLYQEHFGNTEGSGMYVSHSSGVNPVEKNKIISQRIIDIAKEKVNTHFKGFRFNLAHFVVKKAHTMNEMSLHQDWNIVDENSKRNIHVWIPLQLTSPENGGLFLLPYSHLFFDNLRSGSYDITRVPTDEKIKPYMVPLYLMEGDAVGYKTALFHGSYTNHTDFDRVAIIISLVEEDADTLYYHKKSGSEVEVYKIESDDFFSALPVFEKGNIPDGLEPIETRSHRQPFDNASLNSEQLVEAYKAHVRKIGDGHFVRPRVRSIIRSEEMERQIDDVGYTVQPFYDEQQRKELMKLFEPFLPYMHQKKGRVNSIEHSDYNARQEVYKHIEEISRPSFERYFKNYKLPAAILYVKTPSEKNDVDIHWDPTQTLNEHLEPYVGLWVPLVDTSEDNGALQIIPYSHRWGYCLASQNLKTPIYDHKDKVRSLLKTVPMKAGEAMIWDERIVHGSVVNKSSDYRFTVVFRLTHQQARFISIFNETNSNEVEIYEQADNWYFEKDWMDGYKRPTFGKYAGTIHGYKPDFNIEVFSKPELVLAY